VTGYVADEPELTVAVMTPKVGGVLEPAESISNCRVMETPPPGVGFCTVTVTVPALVMAEAGTCAVS
jgi:hypothetical protein